MTGQTPNPESTNLGFFFDKIYCLFWSLFENLNRCIASLLFFENQKTDFRKNKKKSGTVVSGLGVWSDEQVVWGHDRSSHSDSFSAWSSFSGGVVSSSFISFSL